MASQHRLAARNHSWKSLDEEFEIVALDKSLYPLRPRLGLISGSVVQGALKDETDGADPTPLMSPDTSGHNS